MEKCRICKVKLHGRTDMQFCSVKCKNFYHTKLRKISKDAATEIDKHLHRNRSILLEILGKNLTQKKIPRLELQNRSFVFKYHTHYYFNSQNKIMHYVYDFGWMEFSDDEVLVVKKQ